MVICSWAVYFNSHPHKETNHNRRLLLNSYSGISIHVSLRRRTFTERKNNNYTGISTHVSARRRTGSLYHVSARRRTDGLLLVVSNKVFQFTSPYGDERQRRLKILTRLVYFNSRLLTETNVNSTAMVSSLSYFNSRLLTETNFLFLWQMQVAQIFQFTSPYGDELFVFVANASSTDISIHVSLRRRTKKCYLLKLR